MIDAPRIHEILGETYVALRVSEERAFKFEQDYNRSIRLTAELIQSLKDGSITIDDVDVDERGWRVRREVDAAGG